MHHTTEPIVAKDAINAAIELFHRRWVLRILWELRSGPMTFRALQVACNEVSPTVLNLRLKELRAARLVVHASGQGYQLDHHGQSLLDAMQPLMRWSVGWWKDTTTADGAAAQE
jgi:DNA-binding HxlR family transcriptional regulator